MSIWGAVMGHANMMLHGAGWMEGGLVASFEKLIIDAEMLQMMAEFLRPIAVDADELALDAIAQVAPGGHHFGTAHTLARYESAFYMPMLSSRQNFESWREAGSLDAAQRDAPGGHADLEVDAAEAAQLGPVMLAVMAVADCPAKVPASASNRSLP